MSSGFDRTQVQQLADLAALSITEAEAEAIGRDLAAIVAYVEELASVDTSEVAFLAPTTAPWREDALTSGLAREEALAAAPRASDEGFRVPAFIPGATK